MDIENINSIDSQIATNITTFLLSIISIILLATYLILSYGYITYCFWDWFVLPIFPTFPKLNIVQSIGLYFFISLFQSNNNKNKFKFSSILLAPMIALFIGWIFKIIFL